MAFTQKNESLAFSLTAHISKPQRHKQVRALITFMGVMCLFFVLKDLIIEGEDFEWTTSLIAVALVIGTFALVSFPIYKHLAKAKKVKFYQSHFSYMEGKHRRILPYKDIISVREVPIYDTNDYEYSGSLRTIEIEFSKDTLFKTIPLLDNLTQNSIIAHDKRHLSICGIPSDEKPLEKINDIIAQYKQQN